MVKYTLVVAIKLICARKTEKKLPEYNDAEESDTFMFSGAEDLVPALKKDDTGTWIKDESIDGLIKRYRPRIEGGFARIEKITEADGNVYWKVTSKDNIISVFGKSKSAQIFNPESQEYHGTHEGQNEIPDDPVKAFKSG